MRLRGFIIITVIMLGTQGHNQRSIEQLVKMYPRPSPYIDSNLHKFGTGPAATMIPLQNIIPIHHSRLHLNSSSFFQNHAQKNNACYCCFGPIQEIHGEKLQFQIMKESDKSDMVDQPSTQLQQDKSNNIREEKSSQRQTTLMQYFGKQKPVGDVSKQDSNADGVRCCECLKQVCQDCTRVCIRCHALVCKFDYREQNSLGLHYCL